jgi:hypothetical protein
LQSLPLIYYASTPQHAKNKIKIHPIHALFDHNHPSLKNLGLHFVSGLLLAQGPILGFHSANDLVALPYLVENFIIALCMDEKRPSRFSQGWLCTVTCLSNAGPTMITRGVSHCGLAIYIKKKYLKAKEEL